MGMIYEVTEVHGSGSSTVSDTGLDKILTLGTIGRRELLIARNTNWDGHVLYHWEHEWLSATDLPERASLAYSAGPAWERVEARREADRAAKADAERLTAARKLAVAANVRVVSVDRTEADWPQVLVDVRGERRWHPLADLKAAAQQGGDLGAIYSALVADARNAYAPKD